MTPLPSINKAYNIAHQIEKQKEISGLHESTQEAIAFVAQRLTSVCAKKSYQSTYKKGWRREKNDKKCEHCKAKVHTVDQCFKLIGYLDWYQTLQNSKKPGGGKKFADVVSTTQDTAADNPLDFQSNNKIEVDQDLINIVCHEVLKAMKVKQDTGETSSTQVAAFSSFAGSK